MAVRGPTHPSAEEAGRDSVAFAGNACPDLDAWGGSPFETGRHSLAYGRFRSKLDKASQLAAQHLPSSQHRDPGTRLSSGTRRAVAMISPASVLDASPSRLR